MYAREDIAPEVYALLSSELGSAQQLTGDKLHKFQEFFKLEEVYPIYYNNYNIFITHSDEFLLEVASKELTEGLQLSIQLRIPAFHTFVCALNYTGHPFLTSLLS